jgi:hypothetical protein
MDNSINVKKENRLSIAKSISSSQEWLDDNNFSSQGVWYSDETDPTDDVDAVVNNGVADLTVIGDKKTYSLIVDPSNTTEMDKWIQFKKDLDQLYPDNAEKRNDGFYANHYWNENTGQDENNPAVYWKRLVTMPDNMMDYRITGAFVEANFSALVQGDDFDTGGIEAPGDYTYGGPGGVPQNASLDSATFTLDIGDLNLNHVSTPISQYKTKYLGDDDDGTWSWINETQMINYGEEQDLIGDLTSVLGYDHESFTITLGIEMFCADNDYSTDEDNWYELLITSLNLTFVYEKKIDLYTSISWNQDGNKVSDLSNDTIVVTSAIVYLKYKIDQDWTSDSTHSMLRVITNGQSNKVNNSIDLIDYVYSSEFTLVIFDVTDYVTDHVSISIQLFLDDEFVLSSDITISIDDVELWISYVIVTKDPVIQPPPNLTWLIITLIGIIAGIVSYFTAFQLYFKFSPVVRKIRRLKRKIKKGKKSGPLLLRNRESIVKSRLKEHMQILRIQPVQEIVVKQNSMSQSKKIGK